MCSLVEYSSKNIGRPILEQSLCSGNVFSSSEPYLDIFGTWVWASFIFYKYAYVHIIDNEKNKNDTFLLWQSKLNPGVFHTHP